MKIPLPKSIGAPATRALNAAGINGLQDLSKITEKELANLHGVGPKAISILKQFLSENKICLFASGSAKPKKYEIIDGIMYKYHASGTTVWSKGKVIEGQPDGYWQWYRPDGTLKRSGSFELGEPVGTWTTYNEKGEVYKVTKK